MILVKISLVKLEMLMAFKYVELILFLFFFSFEIKWMMHYDF